MKRFFTICMAVCLLWATMISSTLFSVNAAEDTEEIEKIYCDATLEDTFTEKKVLVIIHPDWYDKVYTVDDFAEVNCVSLRLISNLKLKGGHKVQLLSLTIADEGKQKVLDAVHQLETRADIYAAQPNYLVPVTGDTALIPVVVAMLISGTGLAVLAIRRKKNFA